MKRSLTGFHKIFYDACVLSGLLFGHPVVY